LEYEAVARQAASSPCFSAHYTWAASEYSQTVQSPEASVGGAAAVPVEAPAGSAGVVSPGRIRSKPELISVVVPVRNEETFLAEQLIALSEQSYTGAWELVVVDNGSTDATLEVVERFRPRFPEVAVVDASARKGLNYARNAGVTAARGDLIVYCDGDDVVAPGWLAAMAAAAGEADLVGGVTCGEELNDSRTPAWRSRPRKTFLPVKHGFLPHASGGNCAVWRDVVEKIGWDDAFRFGSSDIEFSWRVQLAGYRLGFAPEAILHRRYRQGMLAMVRQSYVYGKSDAQLYRSFRDHGMQRRSVREARASWRRQLTRVSDLANDRRARWLRVAARDVGRVVGSLRWRVLFL
jgi:glycosyltransferase involved in cell wall biosynthesis